MDVVPSGQVIIKGNRCTDLGQGYTYSCGSPLLAGLDKEEGHCAGSMRRLCGVGSHRPSEPTLTSSFIRVRRSFVAALKTASVFPLAPGSALELSE